MNNSITNHTFAKIPNWLLWRKEVTSTAKIIYARLNQYSYKNKMAYPMRSKLSDDIGRCERTVDRGIKELEKFRLIKVRRRGCKKSNLYHLLDHEWMGNSESTLLSSNAESESTFVSTETPSESTFVSTPHKEISKLQDKNIDDSLKNDFETWWKAYPKQQDKISALKAFCVARKKVGFETLMKKTRAYARYRNSANQDLYTLMPYSWLKSERWDDSYGKHDVDPLTITNQRSFALKSNERSPYQAFEPSLDGVPGYLLRQREKERLEGLKAA